MHLKYPKPVEVWGEEKNAKVEDLGGGGNGTLYINI
jgi:hypothetical protein